MKRTRRMTAGRFVLSWDGRVLEGQGGDVREWNELEVIWRPCVIGGSSAQTITGLEGDFLPRGVQLELFALKRKGAECMARYRVRKRRS